LHADRYIEREEIAGPDYYPYLFGYSKMGKPGRVNLFRRSKKGVKSALKKGVKSAFDLY
jgi:hypothetical protein